MQGKEGNMTSQQQKLALAKRKKRNKKRTKAKQSKKIEDNEGVKQADVFEERFHALLKKYDIDEDSDATR